MKYNQEGFSLFEMLVVIGIIALLSSIAIAAVSTARNNARIDKARGDLKQLHTALSLLGNDTNEWPGHQQEGLKCSEHPTGCIAGNEVCQDACAFGLSDEQSGLRQDDSSTPYKNWNGPYIRSIPNDPWGNEYFLDTDYNHPQYGDVAAIGSYAPNGVGNDLYDGDDILLILKR